MSSTNDDEDVEDGGQQDQLALLQEELLALFHSVMASDDGATRAGGSLALSVCIYYPQSAFSLIPH